jgi:DNA adenine methylase
VTCIAETARPFLKWAGGKQQLLTQFEPLFPSQIHRYFEPFVGSGAVFFHLWNTKRLGAEIALSDNNPELVNVYIVVRDQVEELIVHLARHQSLHNREHYYSVRAQDRSNQPMGKVERAARFIYLNRTCYNGLYRVNSRGHFNTPMGSYKNPRVIFAEELRAASAALSSVNLIVQTFDHIVEAVADGDFVYFDPPYDPVSKSASFTGYTSDRFDNLDQERLAAVFRQLSDRGCQCMLSNSCTPFILDLYRDFRIDMVTAKRAVNSVGSRRGPISEVVVRNY